MGGILEKGNATLTLEAHLGEKGAIRLAPHLPIRCVFEQHAPIEMVLHLLGKVERVVKAMRRKLTDGELVFLWGVYEQRDIVRAACLRQGLLDDGFEDFFGREKGVGKRDVEQPRKDELMRSGQ